MVAGTELIASQDAGTGALTVGRRAPHPAPEPTPAADPTPLPPSSPTVKTTTRNLLTAFVSWLAAAGAADAQTAPASRAAPPEAATVTLSPFQVNTSRDDGFVATSALAGGRLNTELKDTPVAYSVLTKEFLDAFNITDLTQAMEWSVNTTYNPGNNVDQGFGFSPAINITIRGAAPGESNYPMRNFFPFNHNTDSYALDRFDFARGPNAILFGAAQFGGTPVSVTKQALTGRTIRQSQLQLGSWSKFRATIDVNQPINEKAAVRVAGMWERGDTYRENEWRKKKAVFLTGTYHLTKATTLRAEGEYAETQQKTFPTFLTDQVSAWDGRTVFAGAIAPGSADVPTAAQQAAAGVAYGTNNANPQFAPLWVFDPTAFGTGDVLNFANFLRTRGATGNATPANRNLIGGRAITSASVNFAGQPM
ncbi:MAG: TonB-dependent receptor plug domain-containing protein, partial [Opitutaceae bacterium]